MAAVLVIGGFFVSKVLSANKIDPAKEKPYTVSRQDLKETLSLSGKVDAEEKATLRFQTSGRLTWIGVREGDLVKKYQTVATLDQREIKSKLDKYLNTYMKTRWDFEQTKDDYKDSIISTEIKRILDKSQFDLNNSVIDVEIQNLSIELANLWSPIEGIVTRVEAPFSGVNITPTQAEIDIVNPGTIYFSALADQNDVAVIKENTSGSIVFDSFPDTDVSGKIKSIAFTPKSGETGTVYEVKVILNRISLPLRMGMTGDVEFVTKVKRKALAIPGSYIKSENGKKYVLKLQNNSKIKTYITVGDEWDESTEVKKGLKEGDIIY